MRQAGPPRKWPLGRAGTGSPGPVLLGPMLASERMAAMRCKTASGLHLGSSNSGHQPMHRQSHASCQKCVRWQISSTTWSEGTWQGAPCGQTRPYTNAEPRLWPLLHGQLQSLYPGDQLATHLLPPCPWPTPGPMWRTPLFVVPRYHMVAKTQLRGNHGTTLVENLCRANASLTQSGRSKQNEP